MSQVLLIAQRELKAYLRSPLGLVIGAAALLGMGIYFIAFALGGTEEKRLSAAVLAKTMEGIGGFLAAAGLILAARLVAYEAEHGTLVVMKTAPVTDRAVIVGKFASVMLVLTVIAGISVYMPALIFVNGKVSIGHILVGYLGALLFAGSLTALGLLSSALVKNQIVAIIIAAILALTLLLLWAIAKESDPPISDFLSGLAIHHMRQRAFMTGVLRFENVIYYLAVTFFFLLGATKIMEARRWQ